MSDPQSLFDRLAAASDSRRPPVERWNPSRSGNSFMRILADGRWLYRDSEIRRPEMVRLFSSILRRDGAHYVLVTPAERLSIVVDDAPFVAVEFERRGSGDAQEIAFETNVGDIVVVDAEHPIEVRGVGDSMKPYVRVRTGLDALITRAAYYRLVEVAQIRGQVHGVCSRGTFFRLE